VKYRTVVADPPWRYVIGKHSGMRGTAESHYPTMGYAEILALPVAEMVDVDAHLYLWVTNPLLTEQRTEGISAADIVRAWGFEPKTMLTWAKNQIGLGFFFRGQTEHVMFGVRGRCPIPEAMRESNLIMAPRTAHSAKPDAFMDLVERVSPGPYLEMFARRKRLGWDTWGNEALEHVEIA
jgi:N6-adenosine-specific RNA methylase IME4